MEKNVDRGHELEAEMISGGGGGGAPCMYVTKTRALSQTILER